MEKANYIKAFIVSIGAFLSAKLGMLYVVIPFLLIAMVGDYITGMLAAKKENNTNSKTGMWGIVKKSYVWCRGCSWNDSRLVNYKCMF